MKKELLILAKKFYQQGDSKLSKEVFQIAKEAEDKETIKEALKELEGMWTKLKEIKEKFENDDSEISNIIPVLLKAQDAIKEAIDYTRFESNAGRFPSVESHNHPPLKKDLPDFWPR